MGAATTSTGTQSEARIGEDELMAGWLHCNSPAANNLQLLTIGPRDVATLLWANQSPSWYDLPSPTSLSALAPAARITED